MLKALTLLFLALVIFLTFNFDGQKNNSHSSSDSSAIDPEDTVLPLPKITRLHAPKNSQQIKSARSFSHIEEEGDESDQLIQPSDFDQGSVTARPTSTVQIPYKAIIDVAAKDQSLLADVLKTHQEEGSSSESPRRSFFRTSSKENLGEAKVAKPSPTPEPLPMVGGQARGYAMLYLMHPKARGVVQAEIQTIIDARIKDVYLGVLVDGTFSKNHAFLREVLKRLNEAERNISLELYLSSGPTMRRYETTPIRTVFSTLEPILFRSRDLFNGNIQNEIKNIAREADETFRFNTSLNPENKNFVSVMLEDNLDSGSYDKMKNITLEAITSQVVFMRNACPGCYPGNDSERRGDLLELHSLSLFPELTTGDGYTLDGVDVMYPHEAEKGDIGIDELTYMIQVAYMKKLSFFGLWKKKRQGLNDTQGQLLHPDDRVYLPPTADERRVEIELLRESLEPLK